MELQRVERAREIFLAHVSHELRTPLAAISARLQLLLSGRIEDPEREQEILTAMARSVVDESRLIEDLIDAARTRTGQMAVERRPANLVTILRHAISAVEPMAAQKKVDLRIEIDAAALPLSADAGRLQQAFWNVLSNAVKFTPPGGRVRVSAQARDEAYRGSGSCSNRLISATSAFGSKGLRKCGNETR